jgi:hypothetical protein
MPAPRKYPAELRERAVRLVLEAWEQEPDLSLNAAVIRIGPRVGINKDTLRGWCNKRSRSSSARTRSCWRHRVSSRGSSTRDCRGDRVHRHAQGHLRGRADLHRVAQAWVWDRPVDVLRGEDPPGLVASRARRGGARSRSAGAYEPEDRPRALRRPQGVARTRPRTNPGRFTPPSVHLDIRPAAGQHCGPTPRDARLERRTLEHVDSSESI